MENTKKTQPVAVQDIIKDVLEKTTINTDSLQGRIVQHWDEMIPEEARRHAMPVMIKNRELIVVVSNSASLHFLTMKKTAIMEYISKKFGTKDIRSIRFKIGIPPEQE